MNTRARDAAEWLCAYDAFCGDPSIWMRGELRHAVAGTVYGRSLATVSFASAAILHAHVLAMSTCHVHPMGATHAYMIVHADQPYKPLRTIYLNDAVAKIVSTMALYA
jgi:hypothetical protein